MRRRVSRSWGLLLGGFLGAGCASAHVLAVRPLPFVVSESSADWSVDVSLELRDVIHVEMINRSERPVSVLWNECAYIDIEKRSHQVRVLSRAHEDGPQRSTVAPGTRVREALVPIGSPLDNSLDPLLPVSKKRRWGVKRRSGSRPSLGAKVPAQHPLIGKEVGLFLVLDRDGERKTLLATYVIERVPSTSATGT